MVDIRQIVANNIYLTQLAEAMDKKGDALIQAIDAEVTPPLRIRASVTPDLVIIIDSIQVSNPIHGRVHTIPPISGTIPAFTSGTITLPASSGGNITNNTGAPVVPLSITAGNYVKIGININASGQLVVAVGTDGTSIAAATIPTTPNGCRAIGYIITQSVGGAIQAVTNDRIVQFSSSSASQGEGAVFSKVSAPVTSTPYSVSFDDYIITVDTTAAVAQTVINLPAVTSAQKGRTLIVKDVGGNLSVFNKGVLLTPNGTNLIEGANSAIIMDIDRMSLTLVCDGSTGWFIV